MPQNPTVLLTSPLNFVPFARTPWGGTLIADVKARGIGLDRATLPSHVGESWEVSTDAQFPSRVASKDGKTLLEVLAADGRAILGESVARRYGSHCPLLLKWLHAAEVLSVQLHPENDNPLLAAGECGKPESWLVLEARPGGYVYLGFAEGLTPEDCLCGLSGPDPASVLFRFEPRQGDLISVPPGLVHAVGPGLLLAEPQYVLPGLSGKTWRLSDWGRRYDANGARCESGTARELHLDAAQGAIDWTLPRGERAVAQLVRHLGESDEFRGDAFNPFATRVFTSPGAHRYDALTDGGFSLVTCYAGSATLGATVLRTGQSGLVPAHFPRVPLALTADDDGRCGVAFFALAPEVSDGVSQ